MKLSKDQTITVSWSTIASMAGSLAAVWAFSAPIVEKALAQEIKQQIEPIASSFEVIIQQNVRSLRNTIAALEFKRDMCGTEPNCWTVRDAQDLANARDDLRAAEAALSGIKGRKQ